MNPLHSCFLVAAATTAALTAQESVEQRLDRLERENRELRQRVDALAASSRGGAATADSGGSGLRRIETAAEGVSLAGYGEFLFTQNSGRTDVADALRTVLYVGYRFDEQWRFHSEIELEHASTDDGGEVALEFGYLEHRASDRFALRAGLVLVPVGLVNEQHEPTLFLPAQRPRTENRILPTTWRELGFEALAEFGDVSVRAFVGTGLDGEDFTAAGLRDGRQEGSRVSAEDVAVALRADWRAAEQLTVGASAFYQQAGQDGLAGATAIPELDTVIAEAHVDWRPGPWTVRALYATAVCDDAGQFDRATGAGLAKRMYGAYGEVGYDLSPWLLPASEVAVTPFVRYERIDTQAAMPGGIAANAAFDSEILTFGINVKPIERIVFKLDYESWSDSYDRLNFAMGYVF